MGYPIAVKIADRAEEEYMKQGWSWYMPEEIVTWHPYFVIQ